MIEDVLAFWLGPPGSPPNLKRWFTRDDALDAEIRTRFGTTIDAAARGELEEWKTTPRGRLALVIVCDQLSRTAFRGTPRAFALDALAREVADRALAEGDLEAHERAPASFLAMPFVHAEDRARQARGIEIFERLADGGADEATARYLAAGVSAAKQHAALVERFGRFPHRNAILGRASTAEEEEYLARPDAFRA